MEPINSQEIIAKATETAQKVVHDAKNTAQTILSTAEHTAHEITEKANTSPTNAELQQSFDSHADQDKEFQVEQKKVNGKTEKSLASIHKKIKEIPSRDETALIVEQVISRLLLSKGRSVYTFIVGASILVGALVVIFGGFKTVLAWIGFQAIVK